MTLLALIRKHDNGKVATAIPAIPAISSCQSNGSKATVARIAIANPLEATNSTPANERMGRVAGKLHSDPQLRFAVDAHVNIDPAAVILTVAIRDKGACEIRIPQSRYDASALLELVGKHTRRETRQ